MEERIKKLKEKYPKDPKQIARDINKLYNPQVKRQYHGTAVQSKYIERLKDFIKKAEIGMKNSDPKTQYHSSISGQLTVLKRELNYMQTHKMVNDEL